MKRSLALSVVLCTLLPDNADVTARGQATAVSSPEYCLIGFPKYSLLPRLLSYTLQFQ